MRNYGGLRKKDPADRTGRADRHAGHHRRQDPLDPYRLCGLLVQDAVIESAYASGVGYAFRMLVIAAFMTSSIPGG